MKLNIKNPLVFFDLETTGTVVSRDRIIEISMLKINPDESQILRTQRINPEMPIPLESTQIHGITDQDVKDSPNFGQVAKSIAQFLEGCDLGGFSIIKFDVPMLVEEFLRVGVEFNIKARKLVDAQKIFFLMEKRNLAAAYKFYCGEDLTDAHSAEADTLASYEVLKAQVSKYEGAEVQDLQGQLIGTIDNSIESLNAVTYSKMVDFAGRMSYGHDNMIIFNFGKHKGRKVSEVLKEEPHYYDWIMKGDFPLDTKRRLTEIKLQDFGK